MSVRVVLYTDFFIVSYACVSVFIDFFTVSYAPADVALLSIDGSSFKMKNGLDKQQKIVRG